MAKQKKVITFLEDISFEGDNCGLALCTVAAASLKDKPYLLKSLNQESVEVAKAAEIDNGNPATNQIKNGKDMDNEKYVELQQEIAQLKKALAVKDAEVVVKQRTDKYSFSAETKESLDAFMVEAEVNKADVSFIVKAFDELLSQKESAVQEAITKSSANPNELQTLLTTEQGHSETQEVEQKDSILKSLEAVNQLFKIKKEGK